MNRLVFEFPASGGVIPSSSFRTVKLYRYMVTNSIFTLVGMLAVVGFVVYFTIEELYEMMYFRQDYFTVFWNIIDFAIVIVSRGLDTHLFNIFSCQKYMSLKDSSIISFRKKKTTRYIL